MLSSPHAVDPAYLSEVAETADSFATRARIVSKRWFRCKLGVDIKPDESPVTIADRQVETALRRLITQRFPDHGLLGEEFGNRNIEAEYVWSIDPVDGTLSFISGHPLWGTLLAVMHRGTPIVGVIDVPALDERWTGSAGQPTRFNAQVCETNGACQHLRQARLYCTSPDIFGTAEKAAFERLSQAVDMRRFGGDCYSYGLLASGHVDLVLEADLKPYDYLAMIPVIEGAGGVISDWSGQTLGMASGGQVLAAANRELHRQALAAITASARW